MEVIFLNKEAAKDHVTKENGAHDIIGFNLDFQVIFKTDENPSRGQILDDIFKVIEDSELFDDYDDIIFTYDYLDVEVDTTNLETVTQMYTVTINDLPN